ncbi:uncharacterized protein [Lolium perenne]|uniref:uncharacterized protein isoform X2 n=2 Tax=Lolium perenne TaxID=4522 RepID=UPI0021F65B73|nr:uncharacterized protein LOC127293758 isoform X2 [Lolium perenne]XP_051179385.1 uncharacterized protein LOC127293758 isoform X3 [Lolium perenne]XP_051179393.1 uncharacterized protein LOC127293758 isoform X2 [Lolium perenne]XP_051179402.1 uncharacterized protein LOC127293758 isoform X2 [Lolium perenne]
MPSLSFALPRRPPGIQAPRMPMYTPAPDGLINFGQLPAMHPYNFRPPPMHHREEGYQNMENLHFVGASPHDSFSTPPPPPHPKAASRSAPAQVGSTSSKRKRKAITVDDDELGERTAYRLTYTPDEHVRLASAWLECSLDPIEGNGKKGEQFWDDIAALYSSTTASNRKRDRNQLKMEWQRTKKRLAAFHGEWLAIIGIYHSGHNTNDLEKMALEKYEGNYHQPFQHLTMWAKLKDDGKWLASYNDMMKKAEKSPSVETNLTSNELNLEVEKRPSAGRDKAKAERAGKGKSGGLSQELGERLDKFIEVNNQSMEDRQKVIDSQVLLSNQQLETAKINNKTKMLDVYSKMLLADTSKMDDGEKAQRSKALSRMEAMLFPGDSGDQGETDGSAATA